MVYQIGIEVDSKRIAWVQNSDRSNSVLTKLTTLTETQSTAVIRFYLKNPKGKYLICTESVRGLNRHRSELPLIDVLTKIEGRSIHYLISVNGRTVKDDKINIRKYTRSKLPLLIILLTAAAAAAAVIFILMPMTRSEPSDRPPDPQQNGNPEVSREAPAAVPSEPPAPVPAEPAEQPAAAESTEAVVDENPAQVQPEKEIEFNWSESEIYDKHSVYFSPDSPILTPDTISMLNSFISALPANEDFEEGHFELAVRGHCAKYGTEEGRADLSRDRAFNVTNYLRNQWGIEADYTTSGAGASEPVSLKRDEQHLNRRVDIEIKGSIRKKIITQQ